MSETYTIQEIAKFIKEIVNPVICPYLCEFVCKPPGHLRCAFEANSFITNRNSKDPPAGSSAGTVLCLPGSEGNRARERSDICGSAD